MPLTRDAIEAALRTVEDPDLHKDLVTLGMVKKIEPDGDRVDLVVELTTPACPMKDRIRGDIEAAVKAKAAELGAVEPEVAVEFTADLASGPIGPYGAP